MNLLGVLLASLTIASTHLYSWVERGTVGMKSLALEEHRNYAHLMTFFLFFFPTRSEVGQVFALSWLITWYGHVLKDFPTIVRLYDFFLATHPLMPVYFGAAVSLCVVFLDTAA